MKMKSLQHFTSTPRAIQYQYDVLYCVGTIDVPYRTIGYRYIIYSYGYWICFLTSYTCFLIYYLNFPGSQGIILREMGGGISSPPPPLYVKYSHMGRTLFSLLTFITYRSSPFHFFFNNLNFRG